MVDVDDPNFRVTARVSGEYRRVHHRVVAQFEFKQRDWIIGSVLL